MSVRTTQKTATYAEAVQHDLKVCRKTALEANRQENLESSESPQYEGDIDIFIVGLTAEEAVQKLEQIGTEMRRNAHRLGKTLMLVAGSG